jgi:hypothetical protein
MAGREDYFLRHVAMLRQLLAQALKLRSAGQTEQATIVLMQAQEKLFGRPPGEVMELGLDEQMRLLETGVSPAEARERQMGYALLLKEAGLCYADRDRPEVAAGAFKTALHIVLRLAASGGPAPEAELLELSRDLLARVPPELIDEPMKELLAEAARRFP